MSNMRRFEWAVVILAVGMTATPARALDAVGEGRRAWLRYNCYGCHGMRAAGGMGRNIQRSTSDEVWVALNGSARSDGMRNYKNIMTYADALNIAAYLATIGTTREPRWNDWWRR